jgi:hypothetical protein
MGFSYKLKNYEKDLKHDVLSPRDEMHSKFGVFDPEM